MGAASLSLLVHLASLPFLTPTCFAMSYRCVHGAPSCSFKDSYGAYHTRLGRHIIVHSCKPLHIPRNREWCRDATAASCARHVYATVSYTFACARRGCVISIQLHYTRCGSAIYAYASLHEVWSMARNPTTLLPNPWHIFHNMLSSQLRLRRPSGYLGCFIRGWGEVESPKGSLLRENVSGQYHRKRKPQS